VRWPDPAAGGDDDAVFYVTTDAAEPCVFHLHGELDLESARVLTELPITIRRDRPVVLDIAELTFCDSIGLTALIKLRRRVVEDLGQLVLRHPTPAISRLLELTGLALVLPVSD
jgi:anti-sigma B factor antagonist